MKKKWYFENLRTEALKYNTKGEFKKKSYGAYQAAHRINLFQEICKHMPKHVDQSGENAPRFKWSLKRLKIEANKYSTRAIFQAKGNEAYQSASRRGLLNKIIDHMEPSKNEAWENEELKLEASQYLTRIDFERNSKGAYECARKRKILDKICAHMKNATNSSKAESNLLGLIKAHYSTAQKFKDMTVIIPNKSHIKGFDIDIFIPELNKGIEFDGIFHHSIKGLKRGRPNWSDEDILNYHEIKDGYFLSKGIQILHVKEEDWIKDKEECVKKCLEFLMLP